MWRRLSLWSEDGEPVCALSVGNPSMRRGFHAASRQDRSRISALDRLRFHPAHGMADQRSDILQFQLFLNVTAVHIDGLGAEMKLFGDVARALALADQLKHFEFT